MEKGGYDESMETIKVRVEKGKIVGDAPSGLPDGTELELQIADPADQLSEQDIQAINQNLEAALRSIREGRVFLADDVISESNSN